MGIWRSWELAKHVTFHETKNKDQGDVYEMVLGKYGSKDRMNTNYGN